MNKLIFLVGNKREETIPVNDSEPYSVTWNPLVMLGDMPAYATSLSESLWDTELKNTSVLTDYDPPANEPVMWVSSADPVDVGFNGYPIIGGARPLEGTSLIRIEKIVDIAYPDRRNELLPKVFQFRVGSAGPFQDLFLMKYSLNAAGTKYVGLRASRDIDGQLTGYISICLDGGTPINTQVVTLADNIVSTETTDSIRLIILHDKIVVHLGNPGIEVLSLDLPKPLIPYAGSHLDIFLEDGDYSSGPANYYAIDGLYIYHGYY